MTDEQAIALGDYCEQLMKNDTFNDLCAQYRDGQVKAMLATSPHETKKREAVYAETWGLQNFLGQLTTFIQQRDNVRARLDADQAEAEEQLADQALRAPVA